MRFAVVMVALVALLAGCSGKPKAAPADTLGDECKPSGPDSYVFGKVTDVEKNPLEGADVTASAVDHNHQISDLTDGRGCYEIVLSPGALHQFKAAKAGYQTKTGPITSADVGEKKKLNFELSH